MDSLNPSGMDFMDSLNPSGMDHLVQGDLRPLFHLVENPTWFDGTNTSQVAFYGYAWWGRILVLMTHYSFLQCHHIRFKALRLRSHFSAQLWLTEAHQIYMIFIYLYWYNVIWLHIHYSEETTQRLCNVPERNEIVAFSTNSHEYRVEPSEKSHKK